MFLSLVKCLVLDSNKTSKHLTIESKKKKKTLKQQTLRKTFLLVWTFFSHDFKPREAAELILTA